jgi:tRNA(fMet)-specific endonuclease VapC
LILLDTDHLNVLAFPADSRRDALTDRLRRVSGETVGITIVSVEEQLRGWLSYIAKARDVARQLPAYSRLADIVRFVNDWHVVPFDEAAAEAFDRFRRMKVRIGSPDLKIASITVTNDALLLTANSRDFDQVPGLRTENWLK